MHVVGRAGTLRRMRSAFSSVTEEQLDRYVYALVDPRVAPDSPQRFFYVGKGVRQRCFQHARAELSERDETSDAPSLKNAIINRIREETGAAPPIVILAHGLPDDPSALDLESLLILVLGTNAGVNGGNAVRGHHASRFVLDVDDVEALYAGRMSADDFCAAVLLVSLNGGKDEKPYPEIRKDEALLASRTLGNWWGAGLAGRKHLVQHVLGVYRGFIRCVFTVDKDARGRAVFEMVRLPSSTGKTTLNRVRFAGTRNAGLEEAWAGKCVVDVDGALISSFGQTPCRLLGV